ncbi:hypothetical protein [Ensifer adhaerens]|uniref:hypothetical protein n=1 Tax=Ensifer adhaerens TaxID=106592 RepID=UPI000DC610B3|nr:hypothetical protein [Ensifer adhaerens]RAS13525.1 hypothetical protein DEU52_106123 [Ensifer adhaerens]
MRKTRMEKSEMSTVEFCQFALRERIAPPSVGSVKERIVYAARKMGWTHTRTRDVWYADPRVSIKADQLVKVEAISGLEYARQEVRKNDDAIARATALLGSQDAHLLGEIVAALLQMVGLQNRTRA